MSAVSTEISIDDAEEFEDVKDEAILSLSADCHQTITHAVPIKHNDAAGCNVCQTELQEPFITCAECPQRFCLRCFSQGAETDIHENRHAYVITHDNVKVFPNSNWSAKEEKKLLDKILRCGFGNWVDISAAMATRTPQECRDHYMKYYFDGIFWKTVGLTKDAYTPETIPFWFKTNTLEPPRHNLEMIHSKNMAGYRFARGDFDTPYDVSAENVVSHLELSKDWGEDFRELGDELNCGVFAAYNNRLRERHRRYQIMREHGLLLPQHTRSWLAKHQEALGLQNGKQVTAGRFLACMQLTTGISFDKVIEGLQYESDLKKYIFKLYELRTNGITTFQGGRIFQKLRMQRTSKIRPKATNTWEWKHLIPNFSSSVNGQAHILQHCMDLSNLPIKRKSTPLNILGLPNYDKLTEDERQLCSTVRLIPDAYLNYKKTLMAENSKTGYLRLADARRLIKIDVNKTRAIYDFFFEKGFINKPFS